MGCWRRWRWGVGRLRLPGRLDLLHQVLWECLTWLAQRVHYRQNADQTLAHCQTMVQGCAAVAQGQSP